MRSTRLSRMLAWELKRRAGAWSACGKGGDLSQRHHTKIYSVCLEHPTYHSVLSLPAVVLHCQSETVGGHAVTEAGVGNPASEITNTRWEVNHRSDIDIRG